MGQIGAVAGEHGVVPLGQAADEVVGIGQGGGRLHLFIRGIQIAVTDVLPDGAGEEVGVLQHDAQAAPQVRLADVVDGDAVVTDLAVGNVVEPVDQVGDGGLAGAGGTHEGQLLAGLGKEADVVEDGLALLIGEVHMVEPHVAGELDEVVVLALDIPDRAQDGAVEGLAVLLVFPGPGLVFSSLGGLQLREGAVRLFPHRDHHHVSAVGDPPGPEVGALLGLLQLVALFVIGHVYQRHSAVVLLRLLVHQGEDPLRAGQGHDDGVELLGDLVDGVGKALGQLQEAGNNAQGDGGVHPAEGQSAAHHSHDHVLDIADVHHDRHQDAGVGVGFVRAVEHFVVDPVKAVLGLLLMAEDLDHFLTVDHLLDITVEGAQGALLAEEVAAAAAGQEPCHHQGEADAHQDHNREQGVGEQHTQEGDQDGHRGVDDLGDALGEHLPQGVHIVGVDAHHVAVGVGVKILDRQGLHVAEQVVPNGFLYALGHHDHVPVIGVSAQGTHQEQATHHHQGPHQAGKVWIRRTQQGGDIVVDQTAQKQRARHVGDGTDQNAHQNNDEAGLVPPFDIAHQAADNVPAMAGRLGAAADLLTAHCHCLLSFGTHRSRGRYHRFSAIRRGYPWPRSVRRPSPGSCRRPRWRRPAGR